MSAALVGEQDFIQVWLNGDGQLRCRLHVCLCSRIVEHGVEILNPAPLSVVHDFSTIQAAMDVRGYKARQLTHDVPRRGDEEICQGVLALGANGEYIDLCDDWPSNRDCRHAEISIHYHVS